MIIKCLDLNKPPHECNAKLYECNRWLNEYAGEKWTAEWKENYGYVNIYDLEVATAFKLKFGL